MVVLYPHVINRYQNKKGAGLDIYPYLGQPLKKNSFKEL